MNASNKVVLGDDGKYYLREEIEVIDTTSAETAETAESTAETAERTESTESTESTEPNNSHITNTISSAMSGPGIGDEVAVRRASLLHSKGEPQLGRRESPEPYDPRPTQMMYLKGALAALAVVIIVVALVVYLGATGDFQL